MERDRLASLQRERELEERRLQNELQLKDILKQQMSELQQREKEVCADACHIPKLGSMHSDNMAVHA